MAKDKMRTNTGETKERKKTECPVSRKRWNNKAPGGANAEIKLPGGPSVSLHLPKKDFTSGAFGFFNNEKVTLMIDGIPVKFQANFQLVAVGSKDLPPEGASTRNDEPEDDEPQE